MTTPQPFIIDAGEVEKRHAPATVRNRGAISDVLETVLPASGTVLEVASGTGEHVIHFAQRFPDLVWQPSDYSAY
jgi:tRNA G46 methylase TrmB